MRTRPLVRLLLDPDPPAEGTPPPERPPAAERVPVSLTPDELEALRADSQELARLRADQAREARTSEERLAAMERRYRSGILNSAIAEAFAGCQFATPKAAEQARKLLSLDVEILEQGDELVIMHKPTGRPLAEVAPSLIDSEDFAHFQARTTRPGTGASGGSRPVESLAPRGSLAERLIDTIRNQPSEPRDAMSGLGGFPAR